MTTMNNSAMNYGMNNSMNSSMSCSMNNGMNRSVNYASAVNTRPAYAAQTYGTRPACTAQAVSTSRPAYTAAQPASNRTVYSSNVRPAYSAQPVDNAGTTCAAQPVSNRPVYSSNVRPVYTAQNNSASARPAYNTQNIGTRPAYNAQTVGTSRPAYNTQNVNAGNAGSQNMQAAQRPVYNQRNGAQNNFAAAGMQKISEKARSTGYSVMTWIGLGSAAIGTLLSVIGLISGMNNGDAACAALIMIGFLFGLVSYILVGGLGKALKSAWNVAKVTWFLIPVFPVDLVLGFLGLVVGIIFFTAMPIIFVLKSVHEKYGK